VFTFFVMKGAVLLLVAYLALVASHGDMIDPMSRLGDRSQADTKKYQHALYGTDGDYPLDSPILKTCGDEDGPAPLPDGVTPRDITWVYTPGSTIDVTWRLTAPHPVNVATPREFVRISVAEQVGSKTTYDFNLAANIIHNDMVPPSTDASGSETLTTDDTKTVQVTLPATFVGNHYVLQWVWDSESDGGGYIDCADIAIRTPLTITLTFKLHYTGSTAITDQSVTNFVSNYFGAWNNQNTVVTLDMTSTDHYDVTVMLTDYQGMPAEQLLAVFYTMYDDPNAQASFETNFQGTISGAADDAPLSGGSTDGSGNPFTGAASTLTVAPLALVVAAIALLFLH